MAEFGEISVFSDFISRQISPFKLPKVRDLSIFHFPFHLQTPRTSGYRPDYSHFSFSWVFLVSLKFRVFFLFYFSKIFSLRKNLKSSECPVNNLAKLQGRPLPHTLEQARFSQTS